MSADIDQRHARQARESRCRSEEIGEGDTRGVKVSGARNRAYIDALWIVAHVGYGASTTAACSRCCIFCGIGGNHGAARGCERCSGERCPEDERGTSERRVCEHRLARECAE